jgi:hypothetical protein
VLFEFVTADCRDNTLSDSTGYVLWGPDTLTAPEWTCPDRPDSLRAVTQIGRYGIRHETVDVGDLNCNGIPFEVGDAVVFVKYMTDGESALCQGQCREIPDCIEHQTSASDVNQDGVSWNVSDLVRLLNLINGVYVAEPYVPGCLDLEVSRIDDGMALSVSSESRIGAAFFRFDYPPELGIGIPSLNEAHRGMEIASAAEDGQLRVLVYSPESIPLETSKGVLFTIPIKNGWDETDETPLSLRDASVSDPHGYPISVSEITTGIRERTRTSSQTLLLDGCWPNPFRGQTTISFHLPARRDLKLLAYNSAGQLVSVLFAGTMEAGHHRIVWDPQGLPSGLYFYTLQSGDLTFTDRAVLLR